jgi:hypothetical protein
MYMYWLLVLFLLLLLFVLSFLLCESWTEIFCVGSNYTHTHTHIYIWPSSSFAHLKFDKGKLGKHGQRAEISGVCVRMCVCVCVRVYVCMCVCVLL